MRLRTLTEQTVIFRNVQSDFVNLVVAASFFLVSTLQDFQVPLSSMARFHFKKALRLFVLSDAPAVIPFHWICQTLEIFCKTSGFKF